MPHTIAVTKASRKLIAPFFENYTLEQLNTIPKGFSNNLIWHIGHIIVTEQILTRKLSGLDLIPSDEIIAKYRKDTKPGEPVSQTEVDLLKSLLFTTIEQTEKDYLAHKFVTYQEYPTSSGFILKNVDDALAYNLFHEGIHLGNMLSMRKLI